MDQVRSIRKTQAGLQQRLTGKGFCMEQLQRICGSVGWNIGTHSSSEIALFFMAQASEKRYSSLSH